MLCRDVFVLQPVGFLLRLRENVLSRTRHAGLRSGRAGKPIQLRFGRLGDAIEVRADLLQQRAHHSFAFCEQRGQKMNRENLRMIALLGKLVVPPSLLPVL